MLPKVRIPSIRCMSIVKHEKTRRELAQATDLESALLGKVSFVFLPNAGVLKYKHDFGQSLHHYLTTLQFHFRISILKQKLRCVITVMLPTMTANIQQKSC